MTASPLPVLVGRHRECAAWTTCWSAFVQVGPEYG